MLLKVAPFKYLRKIPRSRSNRLQGETLLQHYAPAPLKLFKSRLSWPEHRFENSKVQSDFTSYHYLAEQNITFMKSKATFQILQRAFSPLFFVFFRLPVSWMTNPGPRHITIGSEKQSNFPDKNSWKITKITYQSFMVA